MVPPDASFYFAFCTKAIAKCHIVEIYPFGVYICLSINIIDYFCEIYPEPTVADGKSFGVDIQFF